MDAKVKPTWTYPRRLQKLITGLRYGNCNKKCKENLLNLICSISDKPLKSTALFSIRSPFVQVLCADS